MTERQDLRPLSTEDLLPEHGRDRTAHADDQYRTDDYRDSTADRADDVDTTGTAADRYDADATGTTADRYDADADRSVVSDQYDEVDVDADNRAHDGTEQYGQHSDAEPVAAGDTHDETALAHDETPRQTPTTDDGALELFTSEEVDQFRTEWRGLQSDFVDSPRDAVQHADQLVAQVMQSLATTFADHKKSLEGQWSQGEQVETEELRVALRQYRAFFDKLLTV
ncbi:hypothetical protein [Umezawaea sp.]|uniref:hypothetical protein n=1 Tax=Umezawaea sp. TaxID=1955258 RepID=UPI002ED5B9C1